MDATAIAQIVSYFSIGTNLAMLGVAIRVSKYLGKMEFQHEMMWNDYQDRQKANHQYEVGIDRRRSRQD